MSSVTGSLLTMSCVKLYVLGTQQEELKTKIIRNLKLQVVFIINFLLLFVLGVISQILLTSTA